MRNIKITIEYDGTDYRGWQYQPDKNTIQGKIEKALKKIAGEKIRITGAGRTDAGAHAYGQVANFKLESTMKLNSIKAALNANLPQDILIKSIEEVADDFHARFDAGSKTYLYRIIMGYSPLRRRYAWELKFKVDHRLMAKGLKKFLGTHDFTNFSVAAERENRICNILKANMKKERDEILVEIEGDRFLNRMIRMMVGFLVDLGRGRFDVKITNKMFNKDFEKNFLVAPAQGLFLVKVDYK